MQLIHTFTHNDVTYSIFKLLNKKVLEVYKGDEPTGIRYELNNDKDLDARKEYPVAVTILTFRTINKEST